MCIRDSVYTGPVRDRTRDHYRKVGIQRREREKRKDRNGVREREGRNMEEGTYMYMAGMKWRMGGQWKSQPIIGQS